MKKAVLKTILRDFFKLKYPLAMILLIIVLGAGVVWATGNYLTGYRLNHNNPGYTIATLNYQGAILANSSANTDYFVPTKSSGEWTKFLQNCPASVATIPAFTPAGQYYNHTSRCTDANLLCTADYYCVGNGDRTPCPVGTHSATGSVSFSNCIGASNCTPSSGCNCSSQPYQCGGATCGVDSCGNSCGPVCPIDESCNNHHQCQANP